MQIEKYRDDTNSLDFTITFPTGLGFVDILDVIFIVKESGDSPLENALINKLYSNGDILLENTNQIRVKFEDGTEYDNLTTGQVYFAKCLCKFAGQNDFDENVTELEFKIKEAGHNN